MKNIHVLPTDKPSRLKQNNITKKISLVNKGIDLTAYTPINIYIISPNEDINENDYIITKDGRLVQVSYLLSKDIYSASKVTLATDPDLIKDGVQAIDDEFLEWFVKNQSCEEVEIKKTYIVTITNEPIRNWSDYKIIIPKEEPKKETLEEANVYQQELFNYLYDLGIIALQSEMQEIERIVLSTQQEKMYSEEEVLSFGKSCFYEGFEKAEKDDANCFTAFREEIGSLVKKFKNK